MLFRKNPKIKRKQRKEVISIYLDLIEGRISMQNFWNECQKNENIKNVLAYDKKCRYGIWAGDLLFEKNILKIVAYRSAPYDCGWLKEITELFDTFDIEKLRSRSKLAYKIRWFLMVNNINFKFKNEDIEYCEYLYDILPNWLELGIEDLEKILSHAPVELSKAKKQKWCKDKIKETFRYEKRPPMWVECSAWPIIEGVPYVFKFQKKNKEGLYEYHFFNPDDRNKKIIVTQIPD